MYCPRCKIKTDDIFCESCGGATIENGGSEESSEQKKTYSEQFDKDNIKETMSKISKKKIISFILGIAILIGGLIGYKSLQGQYTPKSTVEKYYNYLVDKDYSNAYKLLANTNDEFLSEDIFEKVMDQIDFKGFTIKDFSPEEYKMVYYDPQNSSNFDVTNSSNIFNVNVASKSYPTSIVQDGRKLLFFKDYKIDVSNFTTKWSFTAPKGSVVTINGVEPQKSNDPNVGNLITLNENYKPMIEGYEIAQIFNGSYDVNVTMEGGEEVNLNGVQAGTKTSIKVEPTSNLVKELEGNVKEFLELYYSKATNDKYSKLVSKNSSVLEKLNKFKSDTLINKIQDISVNEKSLEDMEHARISVKCNISYEDNSLVKLGMSKLTGTKDLLTEFNFKKEDGKWLIVDTGYIN